jgi:hypothetical protein
MKKKSCKSSESGGTTGESPVKSRSPFTRSNRIVDEDFELHLKDYSPDRKVSKKLHITPTKKGKGQ